MASAHGLAAVRPANLAAPRRQLGVGTPAVAAHEHLDLLAQLLVMGLGAPVGLAKGGVPELVAFVPTCASSSATRRSSAAMRSSRSRHPGRVTVALTPFQERGKPAAAPQGGVNGWFALHFGVRMAPCASIHALDETRERQRSGSRRT